MDRNKLTSLAIYISHFVAPSGGCDGSLRRSIEWAERSELPVDVVVAWLEEHGAYCDCEVMLNVMTEFLWNDDEPDEGGDLDSSGNVGESRTADRQP